jgi:hypothetical protein
MIIIRSINVQHWKEKSRSLTFNLIDKADLKKEEEKDLHEYPQPVIRPQDIPYAYEAQNSQYFIPGSNRLMDLEPTHNILLHLFHPTTQRFQGIS